MPAWPAVDAPAAAALDDRPADLLITPLRLSEATSSSLLAAAPCSIIRPPAMRRRNWCSGTRLGCPRAASIGCTRGAARQGRVGGRRAGRAGQQGGRRRHSGRGAVEAPAPPRALVHHVAPYSPARPQSPRRPPCPPPHHLQRPSGAGGPGQPWLLATASCGGRTTRGRAGGAGERVGAAERAAAAQARPSGLPSALTDAPQCPLVSGMAGGLPRCPGSEDRQLNPTLSRAGRSPGGSQHRRAGCWLPGPGPGAGGCRRAPRATPAGVRARRAWSACVCWAGGAGAGVLEMRRAGADR